MRVYIVSIDEKCPFVYYWVFWVWLKNFKRRIKFIGHIVSKGGIETEPDKTDKVHHWPMPMTPEEVRKFPGTVFFLPQIIKNFFKMAWPLSEWISILKTSKKSSKKKSKQWKWVMQNRNHSTNRRKLKQRHLFLVLLTTVFHQNFTTMPAR